MVTAKKPSPAARAKPAPASPVVPEAKTAAKPGARPAARPVAKAAPAKATKPVKDNKAAKVAKAPKVDKPRKPKLVRDSFTIPKAEYTVIEELKSRAAKAGIAAKKSELLRAGIKSLAAMDDAAFLAAIQAVPAIKTGRPAKA